VAGGRESAGGIELTQDAYAFVFAQSGLMAKVGMEGSKITRIQP
jgi:lipid-binding SYLF domain-containing protein